MIKKGEVYLAEGAVVCGNVTVGNHVNIWYHATIRGDREAITIGENSNIQDNCVVHVNQGCPVVIGSGVTVGHGAILHGCTIGDNSLIGMGAILLNGSVIGKNCIVAAGALVTQNMQVPDNSVVMGNPGRIRRSVTEEEIQQNIRNAQLYVEEARESLR